MKELLSGDEAIARGAWEAGCNVGCAYPGTPSTEIIENLSKYDEVYCEWSTNEKVALDVASGATFAGARALVAMKHVGLNVASDTLFSMSYSGATGGLVIVSADDPGMWSSQNEQDNRWYAMFAKIPMIEPSDSQEAKDFTKIAFTLSERFDTPILVRITTRIAHSKTVVELGNRVEHKPSGYKKDVKRRLFMPMYARLRHPIVEDRLKKVQEFNDDFEKNYIEWGNEIGVVTSGISYQYVKEAIPDASILKISITYPLPIKLIKQFAKKVKKLYVVEEGDPFLEIQIKALGIKVTGKEKIPICDELDQIKVKETFGQPVVYESQTTNLPARPPVLCPGCPHRPVFYAINKLKLYATGDIGCYTLGALPPLNAMDTCICMGGSIGEAHGINVATPEMSKKIVAIIGDSTFFHAGIPPLIDIVYNQSSTTVIILDNLTTAMTGHQPHPGTGKTAKNEDAPRIMVENIANACGVKNVVVVDPYNLDITKKIIKQQVERDEPSVIIFRRPCVLLGKRNSPVRVEEEKCIACKLCIELGCPAIRLREGKTYINEILCNGCGVCQQLCKKQAIVKGNV